MKDHDSLQKVLPEVLEDNKVKMPHGEYTIMKVGNRDKPIHYNQSTAYRKSGVLLDPTIQPGEPIVLSDGSPWGYFRTSYVKSIYIHKTNSGYDKLILPEGFPAAADFRLAFELDKGDLLIATANSIYHLSRLKLGVPDEIGEPSSDSHAAFLARQGNNHTSSGR